MRPCVADAAGRPGASVTGGRKRAMVSPTGAFEFVDAVCAAPSYVHLPGLADGLSVLLNTVPDSDPWGNLVPDAYLVSIARAHAVPIASFDRDFRRFDGLEIIVPA